MAARIISTKVPPAAAPANARTLRHGAPVRPVSPASLAPAISADHRAPAVEAPRVRKLIIDEASAGQRLDNFLLRCLKGVPKTHVYRIVRSGEVRINGGRAGADTRLALGDEVRLPPVRVAERSDTRPAPAQEFPVLFEDDHLLAIAKPAGIAVHGGSGVSFGVIEQLRSARPSAKFLELVHRLDKETSGILLIAKRRSALTTLQAQFRERRIGKVYAALVIGPWPARRKVIDVSLARYLNAQGERRVRAVPQAAAPAEAEDGARRSITLVKTVHTFAAFTLLDVTIKTGRTHQIRVHLAGEGHAIVGDDKYGDFALNKALARGEALPGIDPGTRFDRMFLHAQRLRFEHPASAQAVELKAALPGECESLLSHLR